MAKAEKTKAMMHMADTAKAFKDAKDKYGKNETDANKAVMNKAKEAHDAAKRVVNRERFVKVGAARASKVIIAVRNFGKVFNPRSYTFERGDADKVLAALRAEMSALETTVNTSLTATAGDKTTEKAQVFSFS